MRSRAQIKKELLEAKEKLASYQKDVTDYNGDSGISRYMFLTSINQLLQGCNQEVSDLEDELNAYSKKNGVPSPR